MDSCIVDLTAGFDQLPLFLEETGSRVSAKMVRLR